MSAAGLIVRSRVPALLISVGVVLALLPAAAADAAVRPSIRINDVTVIEGNSGTTNALFTVSLDRRPLTPVTVDYHTGGGTATPGADYQSRSGSLTFIAGQQSQQIAVPVFGDTVPELDETFQVTLTNPQGGTFAKRTGTGTIQDDEGIPADLVLSLGAPPTGSAGEVLTYIINVTDNGPGSAFDVIVADQVAQDLSVQDISPNCEVSFDNTVQCDVGTIAPGESAVISISVIPNTGGTFPNFAGVFQSSPDPNPRNNFQSASTVVNQP